MKKFLSLLLVVFLLFSSSALSYAEIIKNETVYVNLKHDGSKENIVVVNHISGENGDEYFTDYGKYDSFEVLVNGVEPVIEGDKIKWPTSFLKNNDIYYEGKIDKELPMDLSIKYYLDNKEISGEDIAGKTGDFKIVVSIKDSPDLTMQIQIPLNLNKFSDISVNGGVSSVVGKTMTVVYNHLPMGDGEYVLEAYGENIELDSITIAGTAGDIEIPDNLDSGIKQLVDGIDEMSDATKELHDGSVEINKGTNLLVSGIKSLSNGIYQLFTGTRDISENSNTIIGGFKEINEGLIQFKEHVGGLIAGIGEMNSGLSSLDKENKNIKTGLEGINEGLSGLSEGIQGLDNGLSQLNEGHQGLVQLANSLAKNPDPNVQALVQGVLGEAEAITSLSEGAREASAGAISLAAGTSKLSAGYGEFSNGLSSIAGGFNEMNQGLQTFPQELETMVGGHTQLVNGLEPLFGGIQELNAGMEKMYNETKSMPNQVQELADGQGEISDGLLKLNEEGFGKLKESLDEFSTLGEEKEPYTSFVDNKNNRDSNVQFVMQTPTIKIPESDVDYNMDETKEKKSFIQRFLDLFRK